MRRISFAIAVLLVLSPAMGPTPARADLAFELKGVEVFPGVTSKDCAAGIYVTTGIKFVGRALPTGTWTAKVNVRGALDQSCQPIVCTSPVEIKGGIFVLETLTGILVTDITGSLDFRPSPLLSVICPIAPLTAELEPAFKIGMFQHVTGGNADGELDHSFFPPRIRAGLTLTE